MQKAQSKRIATALTPVVQRSKEWIRMSNVERKTAVRTRRRMKVVWRILLQMRTIMDDDVNPRQQKMVEGVNRGRRSRLRRRPRENEGSMDGGRGYEGIEKVAVRGETVDLSMQGIAVPCWVERGQEWRRCRSAGAVEGLLLVDAVEVATVDPPQRKVRRPMREPS